MLLEAILGRWILSVKAATAAMTTTTARPNQHNVTQSTTIKIMPEIEKALEKENSPLSEKAQHEHKAKSATNWNITLERLKINSLKKNPKTTNMIPI